MSKSTLYILVKFRILGCEISLSISNTEITILFFGNQFTAASIPGLLIKGGNY